jgi:hypothetical protein
VNIPVPTAGTGEGTLPSSDELRAISARDGVDNATSLLFRAVLDSTRQRGFIEAVRSMSQETASYSPPANTRLVIVPGAFHRENPRSGADGHVVRQQAARMGWPVESIPVASTGSLVENAQAICRWLDEHRGGRVVLASVSKGGSDLKMALNQSGADRAFGEVVFWINLCGILDGTPLADWLLSWQVEAALNRLYCRMLGMSVDFLQELRREAGCPLDFGLKLPSHVRLISIVGFPLRRHLTSGMARRCHSRLAPYGPNDAVILLRDVCGQPGLIYPIWGADHYLRSGADMKQVLAGILRYVGKELTECRPAPSATQA